MWQKLGVVGFWLSWPAMWLYLRGSTRTRLLLKVGDEILVIRGWMGDGKWSLPGGGLHRGEDPASGVIRETGEEIGVLLRTEQVNLVLSAMSRDHRLSYYCHYFVTELPGKPQLKLQKLEISAAEWVQLSQIDHSGFSADVLAAVHALDSSKLL